MLPSLSVRFICAPAESSIFAIASNSQITARMKIKSCTWNGQAYSI